MFIHCIEDSDKWKVTLRPWHEYWGERQRGKVDIDVGDYVKILFNIIDKRETKPVGETQQISNEKREAMWVRITKVPFNWGGCFGGVLDNDPVCGYDGRGKEQVFFEEGHVIATKKAEAVL